MIVGLLQSHGIPALGDSAQEPQPPKELNAFQRLMVRLLGGGK